MCGFLVDIRKAFCNVSSTPGVPEYTNRLLLRGSMSSCRNHTASHHLATVQKPLSPHWSHPAKFKFYYNSLAKCIDWVKWMLVTYICLVLMTILYRVETWNMEAADGSLHMIEVRYLQNVESNKEWGAEENWKWQKKVGNHWHIFQHILIHPLPNACLQQAHQSQWLRYVITEMCTGSSFLLTPLILHSLFCLVESQRLNTFVSGDSTLQW